MKQSVRDKLVCGLYNETMQKRLLAEKNFTLAAAIEIAQGMEAAKKQTTELQAATGQSRAHDIQLLSKARAPKPKKKMLSLWSSWPFTFSLSLQRSEK